MSSFFENVKNKVSSVSKSAAKKTKEFADITKLKTEISGAKSTIEDTYSEIGKLYFEQKKDAPDEAFAELVAKINEKLEFIAENEQKIRDVKGEVTCPGCGKLVADKTVMFCPFCGVRIREEPQTEEEAGKTDDGTEK